MPSSAPSPRSKAEAGRSSTAQALRGPLIALAVVVALAVVAVVWGVGRGGNDGGGPVADVSQEGGTAQPSDTLARRVPGDPLAQGDADAPVVLVMWEDFQCPFCAKFAQETEPVLVERFVEAGILRLEWRDFPYFGEQSVQAARAARSAGEQGAFWEFHDAVYALGFPPNSGQLTDDVLIGLARDLDLDVERFTATMQSQETLDAVTADFREGQQLGISGTPAFLLNGRPIMGAQPTDTFVAAIEQAADAAGDDG
ncbi:Protein-disulfide isomerase [Blastococcus aggregatus]|uniref:Protein-disulfide isomerase n=1 Tax=Blastococcus aggregatus TaxID=38502 RepID=A0A285V4F8_9ACTN|nr:thioredoxin domain-containing protein [Blastococcus aggregatus]SOC48950.1 Protein-disulfide isomerase [Blastococcus aggregatus]